MDGTHTIDKCSEVSGKVLRTLFNQLYKQRVDLRGIILKPNMILPGNDCPKQDDLETVAAATISCLMESVPAAVPGIAFLSGGQPAELASARLNQMNGNRDKTLPWALTFSFARAIQQPALEIWKGQRENVKVAQQALYQRARCNNAARRGDYSAAMEMYNY